VEVAKLIQTVCVIALIFIAGYSVTILATQGFQAIFPNLIWLAAGIFSSMLTWAFGAMLEELQRIREYSYEQKEAMIRVQKALENQCGTSGS